MARVALDKSFLTRPIAHRALHDLALGRPENSRAAIKAAIAAGYAIEIDLQLSRDGAAVVFHDEDLSRLTPASGRVADKSLAELQKIPLRGGDETIPSFAEVLALVAGRAPLLIELKDQTLQMAKDDGALPAAAARLLEGYDGPAAVMSFNPHYVARMAELLPGLPRGLTTSAYKPESWAPLAPEICAHLREIPDYERCSASFVSHEARDLTRARVLELKDEGAEILCWTIRSPEAEAEARKIAANITFEGYAAALPT